MSLTLIGVNHRTAPVELREKMSVEKGSESELLNELREGGNLRGVSILSTCNRVEVLASSDDVNPLEPVIGTMADRAGIDQATIEKHLYVLRHKDVIRHMFRLASGLESMIVGEPQIAGQVKDAYQAARHHDTLDSTLFTLYEQTLHVAKRVRTETGIGEDPVSIPFAAVELAKKIFGDLKGLNALLLGAGEMGKLTAEHLHSSGVSNILVANKTFERGQTLAERFGGTAIEFGSFEEHLNKVDIVVGSTAAPDFIVNADMVKSALRKRRGDIFLIDLSVPRNLDPAIADIPAAYLYNVDDLEEITDSNKAKRLERAAHADKIIDSEVEGFLRKLASQDAVPTIVELRQTLDDMRLHELEKCLRKMGPVTAEQRQAIEILSKGIINKVLHYPIVRLKESTTDDSEGETVRETIRRIFGLR